MKTCRRCGIDKENSEFHASKKSRDGIGSYCKSCRSIIDRESYLGSEKRRLSIRKNSDKLKDHNKRLLGRYKRLKGCLACGETEPACLDLHHVNDDKVEDPSNMRSYSTEALKAEIRKCVVICANCHRKVHAGILTL